MWRVFKNKLQCVLCFCCFCWVFFTCFCYHWVTLNGYFSSEKEWRRLCHGRKKLLSPLVNVFEPSNFRCFLLCESSCLSHVKEKSLLYRRRNPSSGQWYTGLQNWFWVSLRASVAFCFCSGNTVKALQVTKGSCVEVWGVPLAPFQCTASPKFITYVEELHLL